MELNVVFDAQPKSVWQVLCENGVGFYIPAYQREYSWDKTNVTRLLEDAGHGLKKLLESEDAITFIGTLIVIHDTKYQTVTPHDRGQLPSRVLLVIDGQQRLITLLLLNTCLHEELSLRLASKEPSWPAFQWLKNKTLPLLDQLSKTFHEDQSYPDEVFRWYPRMIRAFVDSWSRHASNAKYVSPIAAYLHGYSSHLFNKESGKFEYMIPATVQPDDRNKHKVLTDNRRELSNRLRNWVAKGNEDEFEFPGLDKLSTASRFQETLLKEEFPEFVRAQLIGNGEGTDKEKDRFNQLMRLVLFAKFMLERVAVTVVTAKNEDYAFDMFESLNTTGEPLTAFETFRPSVINSEGLHEYDTSPSRQSMKLIEGYLDQYTRAQQKQQATSRLLVPFALAETGDKLSKRLSDQRRYLKDQYERLSDKNAKRDFVRHLGHAAAFVRHGWPEARTESPNLPDVQFGDKDLSAMCLDVLRSTNHEITIGILTRFYSQVRSSQDVAVASKEFEGAIKAITAFFALWRGSRIGTANIDSVYRELMRTQFGNPGSQVGPFARRPPEGDADVLLASKLKAALAFALKTRGEIASRDDWIKKASQVPVYATSEQLSRFLLFAATHDTIPDPQHPGFVQAGRPGTLNMLDLARWANEELEVEHVAPQSQSKTGWDPTIYDAGETIDLLGNLTLVPKRENASL